MERCVISRAVVDLYTRFRGNGDYLVHARVPMTKPQWDEWSLIDEMLQRLTIIAGGLASSRYATASESLLRDVVEDPGILEWLRGTAAKAARDAAKVA